MVAPQTTLITADLEATVTPSVFGGNLVGLCEVSEKLTWCVHRLLAVVRADLAS